MMNLMTNKVMINIIIKPIITKLTVVVMDLIGGFARLLATVLEVSVLL